MSIVAGVLAPHPPHLVYAENPPQNEPRSEGGWEVLRWGYERLRKKLAETDYDVLVVHSPHWKTRTGNHLLAVPRLSGRSVDPIFPNLFRYAFDLRVDVELARAIHAEGRARNLEMQLMENPDFRVDYGTIISCHLVDPAWKKPIVAISSSSAAFDFSNEVGQDEMARLGEATRRALEKTGRRAVLLASCSLSHRHFTTESELPEDMSREHITHHGQYLWDMRVLQLMKEGRSRELMDILPDFTEQAISETKDGSLSWLLAALDYPSYAAEVYAYGSVIGTGNAVVGWHP
ncbi:MAG: tRNA U-34 5-methylaminomethyl-2-thiouridine biosynthesis protein [Holophagaceae bacterium]|nr:tRNA U-34 5-methylaminomethyl-2-thiouridine biosynthesis protein [Holophagaceae bacterium]